MAADEMTVAAMVAKMAKRKRVRTFISFFFLKDSCVLKLLIYFCVFFVKKTKKKSTLFFLFYF